MTERPAKRAGGSELGRRAWTAVVGLPALAAVLAAGALPSALLFGLAAAIALFEYYRLTLVRFGPPGWAGILVAAGLPIVPVLLPGHAAEASAVAVVALAMFAWIHHVLAGPRADAPVRIGYLLTGLLFVVPGLLALSALRAGPRGIVLTAAVLIATFGNDAGALLVGRTLGRRKLLPAVSPGKTWAGLVGGGLVAFALLLGLQQRLGPAFPLRDAVVIGLLCAGFGPLGDLSKSMVKRAHGVKDFGQLLPGHGGMLDRIDALLFNAPAVLAYVWLVR